MLEDFDEPWLKYSLGGGYVVPAKNDYREMTRRLTEHEEPSLPGPVADIRTATSRSNTTLRQVRNNHTPDPRSWLLGPEASPPASQVVDDPRSLGVGMLPWPVVPGAEPGQAGARDLNHDAPQQPGQ